MINLITRSKQICHKGRRLKIVELSIPQLSIMIITNSKWSILYYNLWNYAYVMSQRSVWTEYNKTSLFHMYTPLLLRKRLNVFSYQSTELGIPLAYLLLMNSFNKTEAAVFSCRLCFLRAFPFISLMIF